MTARTVAGRARGGGRSTVLLITARPARARSWSPAAIHAAEPRAAGPFVALNCARAPRGPAGERAVRPREGGVHRRRPPAASAGSSWPTAGRCSWTRSASMPPAAAGKLLRVLQEHDVRAGRRRRARSSVDVRVIAATNRDLDDEVASGRFREDLFYRLNVVPDPPAAAARAAARTSRCWRALPRPVRPRAGRRVHAMSRRRRCRLLARTRGRGTSASCRTSSSGCSSSATKGRSRRRRSPSCSAGRLHGQIQAPFDRSSVAPERAFVVGSGAPPADSGARARRPQPDPRGDPPENQPRAVANPHEAVLAAAVQVAAPVDHSPAAAGEPTPRASIHTAQCRSTQAQPPDPQSRSA